MHSYTVLSKVVIFLSLLTSHNIAFAQCNCPIPRVMHATATSGIVNLEYQEEFKAEQREPSRVEVVVQPSHIPSGGSIVGELEDVIARMKGQVIQQLRSQGIKSQIDIRLSKSSTENLTGNGFMFLNSASGPNGQGGNMTLSLFFRPHYDDGNAPQPGIFKTQVQLRAKVCVEANETHLSFTPNHRRRMAPVIPNSANIPDNVLKQKKQEFSAKVQAEINRIKTELSTLQQPLNQSQRAIIVNTSTEMFEVKIPIVFFGRSYELPVRITPLKQSRICSNSIGG